MTFEIFFETATGFRPYAFQTRFAQSELSSALEVPTGLGKTATSVLAWLWKTETAPSSVGRRLVYCLPMRTLVVQTAENVKRWLMNLGLDIPVFVLMGGDIDNSWEKFPDTRAIIIGTQDQLLSRALNRGYAMSRYKWPVHFAWLNNDCFWVIDEIQLQSSGLSTSCQLQAFRKSLSTFGPSHTLWMSATLDQSSLGTIDNEASTPFILTESEESEVEHLLDARKTLGFLNVDGVKDLIGQVSTLHEPGKLTLVVVNRVETAQELFQGLNKKFDCRLIHSRFRPSDRPSPYGFKGILISTQAVEAGVDISADTLITEIAPWSSMVQRIGRCNRYGSQDGKILWVSTLTTDTSPYEEHEIEEAQTVLKSLVEASPRKLRSISFPKGVTHPVIRRKDVIDLFDTQSGMLGFETDISHFIRTSDDTDVTVLWRSWKDSPKEDASAPRKGEMCQVGIGNFRKFLNKREAWTWDTTEGEWVKVSNKDLYPGIVCLVHTETGGYSSILGWTGKDKDIPGPIEVGQDEPNESNGSDFDSELSFYLSLSQHGIDAEREAKILANALTDVLDDQDCFDIIAAAASHDIGKAHPVFQDMLTQKASEDIKQGVWAKSERSKSGKSSRPGFRHELASAIMYIQKHPDLKSIVPFLILAHHGKARTVIRSLPSEKEPDDGIRYALGVYEGDIVTLDGETHVLELGRLMDFGRDSWVNYTSRLLKEYGPFKLAYLESLVRVADWRASANAKPEEAC